MSHRTLVALLTAVVLLGLASCGIPQDAEPRLIAEEPAISTSSQPADNTGGARTVDVFLIDRREDPVQLAPRARPTEQQPGPLEAVTRLLDPLTDEDEEEEYASAIPQDTQLLSGSIEGDGGIVLDLSEDIGSVAADLRLQAYAQLVYTATQYDASAPVRFRTDGEPNPVPTDEGDMREVTRSDYSSLKPGS